MRTLRLLAVICLVTLGACTPSERSPTPVAQGPVVTPNEKATPGPALVKLTEWLPLGGRSPIGLRPLGDDAWLMVDRGGRLYRVTAGDSRGSDVQQMLDISSEVSTEAEEGLLDAVISPDGDALYLHFTGTEKPFGDIHIRRFDFDGTRVTNGEDILVVEHPYPHHNAGQLQFGPDGFLYISIGDGGTKTLTQDVDNGDPHNFGQGTTELLGNILRIDPSRQDPGKLYAVPKDNPFVGKDGRDEIWAFGLRNPWRFSFDRKAGDMWLPDVGHRYWEEINVEPKGFDGGRNYGWSWREGPTDYKGDAPDDVTEPVYAYPHRNGHCAIIGGFVYRGKKIPSLVGEYVFGDFCAGRLQSVRMKEGKITRHRFIGGEINGLVSLAEDRDGELFVISYTKGIFRVDAA